MEYMTGPMPVDLINLGDILSNGFEINKGGKKVKPLYKKGEIVLRKDTEDEYKIIGYNDNWYDNFGGVTVNYTCKKKNKSGTWSKNYFYILEEDLVPASREQRIKSLKSQKEEMSLEIKEIDKKIDFLENYEDEEDYLAHKIVEILDKKGDKDAVKDVLKEMKKTKLL